MKPENSQQIEQTEIQKLLNPQEEKVVLIQREYWYVLIIPVFLTVFLSFIFSALSFFIFTKLLFFPLIFAFSSLSVIFILINIIAKQIIDWHFHLHVVTDRKILEIRYSPLFSHELCEVLLDQVRCTEVDVKTEGAIRELLDMGDINITFDRPTHQEEFLFQNIKNPRKIANHLYDILNSHNYNSSPVWYKLKKYPEKFRFTEDMPMAIYP